MNHAHVFLNDKTDIFDGDSEDEVPDEDIDERSRSRVRNVILSRESVTNKLKMNRSIYSTVDLTDSGINRSSNNLMVQR